MRQAARLLLASAAAVVVSLVPTAGRAQQAYGDQFLVSDAGSPRTPAVGMDLAGNFVVVWSANPTTPAPVIWGRRFLVDGTPRGEAFQVSSYTWRVLPRVAVARDGRFVVAWVNDAGNTVEARPYDADGNPLSVDFQVSDKVVGLVEKPVDVAIADDGDFLVVWDSSQSTDPTADSLDILAQRFLADGTPDGGLWWVNSHTAGLQKHPRVALNYEGRKAAVVWESSGSPGDDQSLSSVVARVFDNGGPVGLDFQVNQTTSGEQRDPAIDLNADPDNRLVIAWESEVAGGDLAIMGRRFQVEGTPMEGERRFDQWPYGLFINQEDPAVGITAQRDVVVAWESTVTLNGDDLDGSIEGRALYFDGTTSDQDQVNTATAGNQVDAAIAVSDRGDYVVAWWDASGVWARSFLEVGPLFYDGFESGTTVGWSAVAP